LGLSSLAREFYGMPEATKALALKPRNPDHTVPIKVDTFFLSHLKEIKP